MRYCETIGSFRLAAAWEDCRKLKEGGQQQPRSFDLSILLLRSHILKPSAMARHSPFTMFPLNLKRLLTKRVSSLGPRDRAALLFSITPSPAGRCGPPGPGGRSEERRVGKACG